ncbi:MAG: hypothetical protein V4678_04295 [Patescibacteria group bacterium]
MRTKLMVGALLALLVATTAQPVSAHVLIRDVNDSVGAVLHITPDDDPVAGSSADLNFSLQNESLAGSTVQIQITDQASGRTATIKPVSGAGAVSARYVFPSKGVYDITLNISGRANYTFKHVQRVSRGVGTSSLATPDYPVARATLFVGVIALVGLGVFAVDRRKKIITQSTFQ